MTYDNGQKRQLSDKEFDEYFEEIYLNELTDEEKEFSEAETQDDTTEEVAE